MSKKLKTLNMSYRRELFKTTHYFCVGENNTLYISNKIFVDIYMGR
ncbi:MAG: hypothetical protein QXQ25_04420 [Thermoplasmata archaeon]